MTAIEKLAAHIAGYNDLLNILNTLKWDMRTQMPAGGASDSRRAVGDADAAGQKHLRQR